MPETTRKPGGFELCSAVPCCLHSCDQQLEYLVLRNNSFSAPHRCADRGGRGFHEKGEAISEEESLEKDRQGEGGG